MERFLSVIARFDSATEQTLVGMACAAGVEGLDPHLTLGIYEQMPVRSLVERVRRIARRWQRIPVSLCGIGVYFGDWLGVIPRVDSRLLQLHGQLHTGCGGYSARFTAPGDWTPHVSLCACTPQRLRSFVELFRETRGEIISLQVSERREDAFVLLSSFDLARSAGKGFPADEKILDSPQKKW